VSRAVVVGPYPPTADPVGAVTLAEVRALRAAGHDVLVVSPEPSAARVTASPSIRRGARRIARLVRGADVVVWIGTDPPAAVARALRDGPDVRVVRTSVAAPSSSGLAERVRLVRAGGPTFARSLRRRRP
jgi:hypothetical protein